MTKKEIEKRIEEINDNRFYLNMKDHWINEDYRKDNNYKEELRKLKEMLDK